MAVTTFPGAPSYADASMPPLPTLKEGESADEYVKRLSPALTGMQLAVMDMQGSIADGWLVDELRLINLTANTILASQIFTDTMYLGTDGNGGIELDGATPLIKITDSTGQVRFEAGDIGTSTWFRLTDSGGTVRLSSGSTTFIDGAIISNATIDGTSLKDTTVTPGKMNVSTLSSITANVGTLTAGTINATVAINAGAINAGTLTVDGSPAISVTSSGAVVFTSGGDIIMRASVTGDNNYIIFQNSSTTQKGKLYWNSTDDRMWLAGSGTADLALIAGSGLIIIGDDFIPFTGSFLDLGTSSLDYSEGWFDTLNATTYNDIPFRNAFVWTEADKVDPSEPRDSAIYLMKRTTHRSGKTWNWERVLKIDSDGNVHAKNFIPITTEWDAPVSTYFDRDAPQPTLPFHISNAPNNEPHVKKYHERKKKKEKGQNGRGEVTRGARPISDPI